MDEEKILEKYKTFNISPNNIPKYENPIQFAQQFKKCSVLKEGRVYYSSSAHETRIDKNAKLE
jgi:hypothetical protein